MFYGYLKRSSLNRIQLPLDNKNLALDILVSPHKHENVVVEQQGSKVGIYTWYKNNVKGHLRVKSTFYFFITKSAN